MKAARYDLLVLCYSKFYNLYVILHFKLISMLFLFLKLVCTVSMKHDQNKLTINTTPFYLSISVTYICIIVPERITFRNGFVNPNLNCKPRIQFIASYISVITVGKNLSISCMMTNG